MPAQPQQRDADQRGDDGGDQRGGEQAEQGRQAVDAISAAV